MIQDEIMKLQTYKMFEGDSDIYVMRDDVLEVLKQEPCEDCVSRQAVKDMLDARGVKVVMTFEHFKELLDNLPSVTPQQKMGKWIAQDIYNCHTDFKCSECGYIHNFAHLYGEPTADYTYCPNCGTKMERLRNDNSREK